MKQKRYWLRVGTVLFVISLVVGLYCAHSMSTNPISSITGSQASPLDFGPYIHFVPGIMIIAISGFGGSTGFIIGSIVFALLYGIAGSIIGWLYGKLKNRSRMVSQ